MLSIVWFLGCHRAAAVSGWQLGQPHPGTIEYYEDGRLVNTERIESAGGAQAWATTPQGRVPVVRVEARTMGGGHEIAMYGPQHELLSATVMQPPPQHAAAPVGSSP